jgi:hypothetical protein
MIRGQIANGGWPHVASRHRVVVRKVNAAGRLQASPASHKPHGGNRLRLSIRSGGISQALRLPWWLRTKLSSTRRTKMQIARIVKNVLARTYVKELGLAFAFAVGFVLIAAPPIRADELDAAAATADPWRRTATGWELVNRWDGPHHSPEYTPFSLRFDSHPAALALLQALAVVGAFALFPPHRAPANALSGQ